MGTSRGADEAGASYLTGGDGKRRSATAGGGTVQSRWDAGYTVINEEDGSGNLERTFVGRNRAQNGDSPRARRLAWYSPHFAGSTRQVYDQSKVQLAEFGYSPYGRELGSNNRALTTRGYTGHTREAALGGGYYAPFRYYMPSLARWEKRDPLGMVDGPNVYAYVRGEPVGRVDLLGLLARMAGGSALDDELGPLSPAMRDCIISLLAAALLPTPAGILGLPIHALNIGSIVKACEEARIESGGKPIFEPLVDPKLLLDVPELGAPSNCLAGTFHREPRRPGRCSCRTPMGGRQVYFDCDWDLAQQHCQHPNQSLFD